MDFMYVHYDVVVVTVPHHAIPTPPTRMINRDLLRFKRRGKFWEI